MLLQPAVDEDSIKSPLGLALRLAFISPTACAIRMDGWGTLLQEHFNLVRYEVTAHRRPNLEAHQDAGKTSPWTSHAAVCGRSVISSPALIPSKDLIHLEFLGKNSCRCYQPCFQGVPQPWSQYTHHNHANNHLPWSKAHHLRTQAPCTDFTLAIGSAVQRPRFPTSCLPSQNSYVFLRLPLVNLWLQHIIRETRAWY